MFEIYKEKKWTYLIPVVMFWGVVPILLYVFIKDIIDKGFSLTTIMGAICIAMVGFFGYMFLCLFRTDPYEQLRRLQKENPELVARMEADFQAGRNLCPHIWKGQEFYFFEGGMNLLVVPIGQVKSMSLRKGYSRSIGPHYDCCVEAQNGKAEFAAAFVNRDTRELLSVAKMIAMESGFALDLERVTEEDFNP